ncbi:MAG: protease SohB [Arenicellales bacterium]|jgi:serine protease SohB|nr:protease SohB [Arenicellales bacterium]MDP6552644.1 protease SohB [Arenicellales bacterium]MDP6791190.1 protease SohB [Arenicellales bacterium]MDP6917807.1 protease SohB [Arenicellales bacterium]|tara:strand:- start:5609 stop:6643 length:1035 start_codon:yes stop_codon:yes gene_type:complete
MAYLAEYGLFFAKVLTLFLMIVGVLVSLVGIAMRNRHAPSEQIEVKRINDRYRDMADAVEMATLAPALVKKRQKTQKKERKAEAKAQKHAPEEFKKRVFVLNFHGDIRASEVALLREEVTAILLGVREGDEVVVRLESAGGMVHAYGLAASQILRLRDAGVHVTVSVDKVAASGGYLMACVANRILAAPFAVIGSIGVVAEIPNFNRLLKKHDIDYEQISAGEYKRTITLLGETTDRARAKVKQEVEQTHTLFKDFVKERRPVVDLDAVATGEHWLGSQAYHLKLVDDIRTSDDYLMSLRETADIFEVEYTVKKKVLDRLSGLISQLRKGRLLSEENAAFTRLS